MSKNDLDHAVKDAIRAQQEADKKAFDNDTNKDAWRRLAERYRSLVARQQAGQISDDDFARERRELDKQGKWLANLAAQNMGLLRASFAGLGDGAFAAVAALAWQLGAMGLNAVAWFLAIALGVVVVLRLVQGVLRGGARAARIVHRPAWWTAKGLGFYAIALPLFVVAWSRPITAPFADLMAVAAFVYWVLSVVSLLPAGLNALFKRAAAQRHSDRWRAVDSQNSRNPDAHANMSRIEAQGPAHRNLFLANALAVALPLLALPIASPIAARTNYLTLRAVDASQMPEGSRVKTPAAMAMAQQLKSRAQTALEAARKASAEPTPSWLQEQALGDVRYAAWGKLGADGLRGVATASGFYKGVWRPAGVWVIDSRSAYGSDRAALAQGVLFVPFYTDASCKTLATDFAARDKEWLRSQTSGADRYMEESRRPYVDFAAANSVPEQTVACVGEPIALLAKSAPADVRFEPVEQSQFQRLALLTEVVDWSDARQRMANGTPRSQALSAKLEKIFDSFGTFNREK